MEISPNKIIDEMNRQFPREFQICVQAVQIRALQAQLEGEQDGKDTDTVVE